MGGRSVLVLWCFCLVLSQALPPQLDITLLEATGHQCRGDMDTLRQGLVSSQLWAQAVTEAGVRAPSGLLSHTAVQFGDFDECLDADTPFDTEYCLVDVSPKADNYTTWHRFFWAVCIPSSCSEELQGSMQNYMDDKVSGDDGVQVTVIPAACTTRATVSRDITWKDILYSLVVGAVFLLISTATAWDCLYSTKPDFNSPPASAVECLSARRAWASLWRADNPVEGVNLGCLYAIHSIAIFNIVQGHRFGIYLAFMSITNYKDIEHLFSKSWLSFFSTHMDLFVDVFFFMSAFLLSLLYQAQLQRRFVNPLMVCFYRYIRMAPAYAVVVFFYATLLRQLGDGPLWNLTMDGEQQTCTDYWWTNLFFLNNYVYKANICIGQTWYLSCDFQLFIIGAFLGLLLHQNLRFGLLVAGTLFVVSTLLLFLGTYVHNRPALMVFDKSFWTNPRHNDMFSSVYSQAHYRVTSFLPGLLTGCYVFRNKNNPLTKGWTYFLQAGGAIIMMLVFCSGVPFYDLKNRPSQMTEALYASFFHTIFGTGLSLFVISCVLGKPTAVSKALSWRGFVPVSKLSYAVFLTHLLPQFYWIASSRSPLYFSVFHLVTGTISDMVVCLILSLVLFLTVETPVRYLVKFLVLSITQEKLQNFSGTSNTTKKQSFHRRELYIVNDEK